MVGPLSNSVQIYNSGSNSFDVVSQAAKVTRCFLELICSAVERYGLGKSVSWILLPSATIDATALAEKNICGIPYPLNLARMYYPSLPGSSPMDHQERGISRAKMAWFILESARLYWPLKHLVESSVACISKNVY